MPRKTNKTSHVLNLITNGTPETEEAQETPEAKKSSEKSPDSSAKDAAAVKETGVSQPEAQKSAPENKVIVVNETSENEKLSNEIKNRLEAQLEAEIAQERGTSAAVSTEQTEEKEQEPVKMESADMQESAETETKPAEPEEALESAEISEGAGEKKETAVVPEAEHSEKAAASEEKKPEEVTYRMMNVMERLLNDMNLDEQMEQYGVCRCSRCKADVQALVLTRLPAKYVIVDETQTSPLIGFYKGSFHVRIFTEIMKACMTVKESPRH